MPSSIEMIGYLPTQLVERVDPFGRAQRQAFAFEPVGAVLVELARRAVEADRDLRAGDVAGLLDRLEDHLDRRLVVGGARREAAFVADRRAHAARRR